MRGGGIATGLGGPRDVEPYVALLEEAAAWLQARGIRQWAPGTLRARASDFATRTAKGQLLVARDGAALAGGCLLTPDPSPEWAGGAGVALHLHKLVVARSHAGIGLAQRLLAFGDERARQLGVARLRLDCWDGNTRLRALYRDAGWRELQAVPSEGYTVRLFERDVPARG